VFHFTGNEIIQRRIKHKTVFRPLHPPCLAGVNHFSLSAGTAHGWDALAAGLSDLHWLPALGYVLLLDHAQALQVEAREAFGKLHRMLDGVAKHWHARGVPFFVFLEYPDNETRDAAIDA